MMGKGFLVRQRVLKVHYLVTAANVPLLFMKISIEAYAQLILHSLGGVLLFRLNNFVHMVSQGTVRLIFQPAEEGGAGASYMIKEGALGNAEAIFGMHVDYCESTGSIATRSGPVLAAVSFFEAKIEGNGGHAAEPHKSTDPILAASFAVLALQQLISREVDPLHSQVCPHYVSFFYLTWCTIFDTS